ncbi:MAG TPA: 1,6-anhydro-N-acetylmuramyl-L-alanine amidase AmpD [Gammaproteobacteria bacterium]|nr:1,6-anhydro-N-acetylmuramyl-L-alanine amidase AmpD [Gammaproteobacteria bacterium]
MKVDNISGWLGQAIRVPSPNYDERPAHTVIDLIVIHSISLPPGEYGGPFIDALFTNSLAADAHPYFQDIHAMRVSAHALIRRDGAIVQYVPFHLRAWHAGESCFENRARCNDYSIGIELEGSDEVPYEPAQYQALAELIQALSAAYPTLSPQRLVGHCDIAPGRKTDPGPAFDWQQLRRLIGY